MRGRIIDYLTLYMYMYGTMGTLCLLSFVIRCVSTPKKADRFILNLTLKLNHQRVLLTGLHNLIGRNCHYSVDLVQRISTFNFTAISFTNDNISNGQPIAMYDYQIGGFLDRDANIHNSQERFLLQIWHNSEMVIIRLDRIR